MRTVAILPIKSFNGAKQRLANTMSPGAGGRSPRRCTRTSWSRSDVRGRSIGVLVVTADSNAQQIAGGYGAMVLGDDGQGHNPAARRGIRAALESGAERALLVPGDCPLIDPSQLDELIGRDVDERSVLIVPDRHGTGTNALLMTPPDSLAPAFGPGSCQRHAASAQPRGPPRGRRRPFAGARHRHPGGPRGPARRARFHARRRGAHPRDDPPAHAKRDLITAVALERTAGGRGRRRPRGPHHSRAAPRRRGADGRSRARDRPQGRVQGGGPCAQAGRRGAGPQSATARPRTRQGPAPRAGRPRRIARGTPRRARGHDLCDPPRFRLRERRGRRVQRSRGWDRHPPAAGPGRLGAPDPWRSAAGC